MPLAARSARAARASPAAHGNPRTPSAPAASRASIAPREIFGSDKLSARTSVQNEAIYVVIPLRVDRSICGMQAVLRISFPVERNRPTPPGPDRVVPLALPPGEGDHLFLFGCQWQPSQPLFTAGGRPLHPRCGLRPRKPGCSTGLRPTCGGRVWDARQGIPTLRRNPIRLVGLVPPEIGISRSCKAQAAHPECHGPVYAGVSAASVISALTSRRGHRNLKRRWIGLGPGGPPRRAWTGESCRCRTWGTGRRRGSPSRTGRR